MDACVPLNQTRCHPRSTVAPDQSVIWRYAAPFCIKSYLEHTCACMKPHV
jgi:hypothetical protein